MLTPFNYDFDPENPRHWWFGDCQDEELFLCWDYEYSRDCPNLIKEALAWRQKYGFPERFPVQLYTVIPTPQFFEGWPKLPYLEIDPEIRRFHCKLTQFCATALHRTLPKRNPVAVFGHDWDRSDEELIREFRKHLRNDRPRDVVIRERRGRRRVPQNCRRFLKELGAWRLSHVMSQTKAIEFAKDCGKPLYENQSALARAIRRVECYLTWLNNPALYPQ